MRRIDDAGEGVNTMDVPFRFIPCLVAGLAYYLALKLPNSMDRLGVLKQQYDEAWQMAADEDREKASVRFVPRQQFIGSGT
jgi:ethanolamine utilization microcompartment shell protein EutL